MNQYISSREVGNIQGARIASWNVVASFCMAGASPSGVHVRWRKDCSLLTMVHNQGSYTASAAAWAVEKAIWRL